MQATQATPSSKVTAGNPFFNVTGEWE